MQPEFIDRIYHPKMEYYRNVFQNSVRWDGFESLTNKTVIVYCEQGYGDILQFARYIPHLKKLGCKVILYCPKALHQLFLKCLPGVDEVLDKENSDLPPHDYHTLTMSLPFVLNLVGVEAPYLHVTEQTDLQELNGCFKIGVAWEGNPDHTNNDERSCPLKILQRIHDHPKVKLILIQKEIHSAQYVQGCEDFKIYGTELTDFYDTAKLINGLDLVISVDTAAMHLAGAMSKPTLGLLSYKKDPRWEIDIDWYPCIKQILQPEENNWSSIEAKLTMHTNMHIAKWNPCES